MLCPLCRSQFAYGTRICPTDGMELTSRGERFLGRLIDSRYRIIDRIGKGGMCLVYRVVHEPTNEARAMKVLPPSRGADALARAQFLREATVAARLDHENIVQVSELGETEDGFVFIVMELLSGPNLSKVVENNPLPENRALHIGLQIASALARAHDLGVIHRDVKSDNVMFTGDPRETNHVKLLDFGLAATLDDHPLTPTGQLFGTPEYLSPEQCIGDHATPVSDLYSLGVVLYEMLTGKPPFEGSATQVMHAHLDSTPRAPSVELGPLTISPATDALVLRLLEKNPARRHPSAHGLVETIMDMMGRPSPQKPTVAATPSSHFKTAQSEDTAGAQARAHLQKFLWPLLLVATFAAAGCLPWSSIDPLATGPIGTVTSGGLRGGIELPPKGEHHLFYRPQRGRRHASDSLARALLSAAQKVDERFPGSRLVIGDLSAAAGTSLSGHRSHQNGLDADLGFFRRKLSGEPVAPGTDHRFDRFGVALVRGGPTLFDDERNLALIESLLKGTHVEIRWIFASHATKQRLLAAALRRGMDNELLQRMAQVLRRPSDSTPHDDHFHVRAFCPPKAALCIDQGPAWDWTPLAKARRQPVWTD